MKLAFFAAAVALAIPAVQAQTPPAGAKASPRFTLDTPISVLMADSRARAVVESTLPGLSSRPNFNRVKGMSLRQLQKVTDGRLSNEKLKQAEQRLAAIK